jgi:hypothetical protein
MLSGPHRYRLPGLISWSLNGEPISAELGEKMANDYMREAADL